MTGSEPLRLLIGGGVWWAALIGGEGAAAFLGTQGDQWDTQWDMLLALLGAATALLLLSRLHDRAMATLEATSHV